MAKTKRKTRQQYQPPPQGDIGPTTAAQMDGAEILTIREDNGALFRRKRRDHAVEKLHKAGAINARQAAAGMELYRLYCKTQLSPDSAFTRVYVDSAPRPDDTAVMQAERTMEFVRLSKHVPRAMYPVVRHVVLDGKNLRAGFSKNGQDASSHMAMLQVALDLVANEMRI